MLTIRAAEEAIWHFFGLIHKADEFSRLRLDYDRMAAIKAEVDPGNIVLISVTGEHPYQPQDFLPELHYQPKGTSPGDVEVKLSNLPQALERQPVPGHHAPDEGFDGRLVGVGNHGWDHPGTPIFPEPPDPPIGGMLPPEVSGPTPEFHTWWPDWELPVPGSYALFVVQQTTLLDDDLIGHDGQSLASLAAQHFGAELQELAGLADRLGLDLRLDPPSGEDAFLHMARAFGAVQVPDEQIEGAQVWTRHGDAVQGKYLNGVAVDDAPDIEALMPAYRAEQRENLDRADLFGNHPFAPNDDSPQHELVYGNNTLVNEASITDAWITAPVMAAAKGAYSYTLVSQVNVWSDSDTLTTQLGQPPAHVVDSPTQALNYASFSVFSNPMPQHAGDGDAPQYWLTATVEGSLLSVNWIDQYNFVSDDDVTTVSLQGEASLWLMGQNGSFNQISLTALGSQFDLILIDGYIINLNAVLQTNVMLDNDHIAAGGAGTTISGGDNLLVNYSNIVQVGDSSFSSTNTAFDTMLRTAADGKVSLPAGVLNDPAFQGLDIVRVLHIEGDLVSVNMIRQTNILGDSDEIQPYLQDVVDTGGEVKVIAGSNVLINSASIAEFGVDSHVYVGGDYYSDAVLHQAELVSSDAPVLPANDLASEAVLFLADGMIGEDGDEAPIQPIDAHHHASPDAMTTVLA